MKPYRQPVRLLPNEPLPPYSFVPGKFPHPHSDAAGHSPDTVRDVPVEIDPEQWHQCKVYLWGIDLFNAGYYWESHVEFEKLWLGAGRKGPMADFFKALIQLAAAGVKHLEGIPEGVRSHSLRAEQLLREAPLVPLTQGEIVFGFSIPKLSELAEVIGRTGWPHPAPVLTLEQRIGA